MSDPQRAEWERHETESLAKRRCPYSGSWLAPRQYFDGPIDRDAEPNVYSCPVCDCFGFGPEEVGLK